jgi:transposase
MGRTKRYKRYSPEFKREALKRASEDGITDKLVCEELGISARQLRRWRDEYRLLGDEAFPGQGHSRDEELTKLKRKLAKVEQERDFLKDAAVFFAKESK